MAGPVETWLERAGERERDAHVLREQGRLLGAVYMAGYAVECSLKALVQLQGGKFPTHGPGGHNLRNLSEAAGFKRADLPTLRRQFLDGWCTDLRYSTCFPEGVDGESLYEGARELVFKVKTMIKYSRRRRWR